MMGPQRVKNQLLSWPPSIWSKWMYNVKAYHSLHALVLSSNQMQKRYSGHTFFQPSCNPASSFNRTSWTRNTNHARLLYFGYFWFLDFFLGNRKSNLFVVPLCFRHLRHWRGWSFDDLRLRPGFYLHFRLQCYWKTRQRGDGFSTRHTGLVTKFIKSII